LPLIILHEFFEKQDLKGKLGIGLILSLFALPVRAVTADPANLNTADCALFCHCEDGLDYAVKDSSSGNHVQHSEWFCKHLGDMVGISSPECRIVEVNGENAFGSRWESGHDPSDWWIRIMDGSIQKDRVAPTISRILAFDLFMDNIDRHASNYIVRPQIGGAWSFLAFDHSKAWVANNWPLKIPPMAAGSNTRNNFSLINKLVGDLLIPAQAIWVLDKIKDVNLSAIELIIDQHPPEWLKADEKIAILDFWKNGQMELRAEQIKKGFQNDEYI